MSKHWSIIDRWDVDNDGAEDMIVTDGEKTILLARRHNLGAADPATWCMAYDCVDADAKAVRDAVSEGGEHIAIIAERYQPLDWPSWTVANIASAARA